MAATRPLSRSGNGEEHRVRGRNYADRVREMQSEVPSEPALFLKPARLRPEGSRALMPACSRNLHHELELGVVMGKRGRAVSEAAARNYVAGYALCPDMTARDVQDECKKKGLPWTLAESFTASCPVNAFVPKEKIPDPHNLKLWLKVNGELRQEGETSSMFSEIMILEEGDIILTGTPKGVGPVKENDETQAVIHGVVSKKFKVGRPKY
ncbi:oxaloacetate tautomerase FAHD1, mitochondrial-like [Vicugna pacos]|uniref:Oxaloacetate tautomerase FAHD1, mitochondrial n=1 Tax=Vicugna pacos TaxID=30538 RepID=A0A6J0AQU0_VICPA